jgi:hypothetical protein
MLAPEANRVAFGLAGGNVVQRLPTIDGVAIRVGDVVEVRSAEEIVATLDENGEFESLPFMPEMMAYCNQRLTVHKVATKLCNTISGGGMRKMMNAVHLTGARCDGSGHGACQAACLIFWKTAWLKRVDAASDAPAALPRQDASPEFAQLETLVTRMSRREPDAEGRERFRCQATELDRAAPEPLPVRDLTQFVDDVRTGNASPWWSFRALLIALYNRFQDKSARLPARLRIRGGRRYGDLSGEPGSTPSGHTDLVPGEVVRIKSRAEIAATLNTKLMNRGLGLDAEGVRHCGKTATVARRVDHIIDERTGRMIVMREPCIVLDGIVCEGAYTVNCPREIPTYWREIWLDRVDTPAGPPSPQSEAAGVG